MKSVAGNKHPSLKVHLVPHPIYEQEAGFQCGFLGRWVRPHQNVD